MESIQQGSQLEELLTLPSEIIQTKQRFLVVTSDRLLFFNAIQLVPSGLQKTKNPQLYIELTTRMSTNSILQCCSCPIPENAKPGSIELLKRSITINSEFGSMIIITNNQQQAQNIISIISGHTKESLLNKTV